MGFDWGFALIPLTGGITLLICAYLSKNYEKTVFAPATAMLLTWGVALTILSFLPLIGFYYVSAEAVLLYVFGAGWFAIVALLTTFLLNSFSKKNEMYQNLELESLNYTHIVYFWTFISFASYPFAYSEILSHGSNLTEISYNIRRLSVSGESILNPVLNNIFVIVGILANIVLFGVIKKKVKLTTFLAVALPFLFISLVLSGRSGLVSLILGWFVIISVLSNRVKFRIFVLPIILLLAIIFFGGVFVKKFDIEGKGGSDTFIVLFEHVFGYLYQGPILFSRYFNNEIDIATNWDFFNSACHVLSKVGLCVPSSIHADFAGYSPENMGNVYSIYFSIIPHYGMFGLIVVFSIYAILLAFLFHKLKSLSLFAVVVYPLMFSAIVLSTFKDSIGYSFYFLLKAGIAIYVINFLFSIKNNYKPTK
ncbi:O-antigen polymerase [Shewanella sp. T24-MNA-CIBAN-0130]|uniref:O-antigen polymerase n=1 Tax=Shewanella sp. T24-MNA-CIBAN-0130 TaxID=3140470 RepID=UPI00333379EA